MVSSVQILYWCDIPVQVRAKKGRERFSVELAPRFQIAIDNAAMQAGLVGSDAYTDQFHWSDPEERAGQPEEAARAVAGELEMRFPTVEWRKTVEKLGGRPAIK